MQKRVWVDGYVIATNRQIIITFFLFVCLCIRASIFLCLVVGCVQVRVCMCVCVWKRNREIERRSKSEIKFWNLCTIWAPKVSDLTKRINYVSGVNFKFFFCFREISELKKKLCSGFFASSWRSLSRWKMSRNQDRYSVEKKSSSGKSQNKKKKERKNFGVKNYPRFLSLNDRTSTKVQRLPSWSSQLKSSRLWIQPKGLN